MKVNQIYSIVNDVTKEVLGETAIVNEDLSNIVSIGESVFNANAFDNYVKSLIDHIGKIVFVDRVYQGSAPKVLMDNWEFGSILEKVSMDLPDATENESWELQDGASYDTNIFYQPKIQVKFYNDLTTFEVPMSITELQVKEAFSNVTQLNSFLSMIYNKIDSTLTVKTDALVLRTIDNFIAETIHAEYGNNALNSTSTVKAVNLLYLYNQTHTPTLTASNCMQEPEFIRFASYYIKLYATRLKTMSRLFNIGEQARFTPRDLLHIVLLNEFKESADIWLQSSTFHDEFTKLPEADVVAYWQGSGTDFAFSNTSKIDVKLASDNSKTVQASGILGVMFDRDALGVNLFNKRVKTHYVEKSEFTNVWHKQDARYFNDFNENFVVFFVA